MLCTTHRALARRRRGSRHGHRTTAGGRHGHQTTAATFFAKQFAPFFSVAFARATASGVLAHLSYLYDEARPPKKTANKSGPRPECKQRKEAEENQSKPTLMKAKETKSRKCEVAFVWVCCERSKICPGNKADLSRAADVQT
jgi:hypothetical protein